MIGLAAVSVEVAHSWLANLAQAATGSLVAAVWQGMLLTAAAGLGLRLLPKTPAAVRFAIWFGVFLMVAALPAISLWPHAGTAGGRSAWIVVDERWCLAIAAVWLAASLVRAGTLVAAALRVRALWKRAKPVEIPTAGPSTAQAAGATCYAQDYSSYQDDSFYQDDSSYQDDNSYLTSTSRRAQICTSDEVDRPTVIGFCSPKILIPEWLLEKLSPAELEQIVLHERGHLGRADDWMNLLQKIALVVFPLNPALAWVERRLCFERELAVDERVLQATGAPKAYAACLANLAGHRLERRGLALVLGALGRESHPSQQAGWGPRSELGRRVGRILRRGERMKPLHAKLVLGGAMLGLLVAAAGFERCPQVVSFSNGGSEAVAHGQQWLPTHGDETAMNGAPGLVSGRIFRAVSVTYKAPETREIQTIVRVAHEMRAVVSDSSPRQNKGTEIGDKVQGPADRRADGSVRMVQTVAQASAARNVSRTVSDEVPAQPANGMMQWVVVTTWQDGQATRMVFATARVSNKALMVEQDGEGPASEQVPSYAAVPVRGGWLVIQL
jgi:Zn-dependent protease with chaperone function